MDTAKINRKGLLSILFLIIASVLQAQPPGSGWTLSWSDEFNGTSVDSLKWKIDDNKTRSADENKTCYEKENVSVSGGILKLTVNNNGCDCAGTIYSGGAISNTAAYSNNKYGYIEARIRYNCTGPGFWGNFWMNSSEGWPPEFDIAELISNEPTKMTIAYHYNDENSVHQSTGSRPLCNWHDWHIYGIEWLDVDGPNLNFYIDGVKVFSPTQSQAYPPDEKMYVILRMGAFNSEGWGGTPDGTTVWPGSAEYDWIKVWSKTSNPDNKAPTVYLFTPANNSVYDAYSDVLLSPLVTDVDGKITKVEFYNGTTKITDVVTKPYKYTWNNVPPGSYSITARAYDNDGAVKTSMAINFIVNGGVGLSGESQKISMYPNVTDGIINISNAAGLFYTVTSVSGSTILIGRIGNDFIDITTLQSGIYFLRIIKEKEIFIEKIIRK